jgi:hypothetical protein
MPFRPNIPVWAPDPAVPLLARILAYVFTAFLLLTIFRALTMPRPLDYPEMPKSWKSASANGITLQYPDDWQMVRYTHRATWVETDMDFYYTPPTRSMMQLHMITTSDMQVNPQEDIVEKLIDHYTEQPTNTDDTSTTSWHAFSGNPPRSEQPIQGAWVAQLVGNHLVVLLAYAPGQGWAVTQQILSYMSEHVVSTE